MFKNMTVKKKKAIVAFELISMSLIIAIMGFYALRLYRSYKDMKQRMQDAADLAELRLYQVLEAGVDMLCTNNGLVYVPGTNDIDDNDYETISSDYYYYCGNVTNNYVSYSGRLYRMLDINGSGEIRVISEEPITDMVFENKTFAQSMLYSFLNENGENTGLYYHSLRFSQRLLSTFTQSVLVLDKTAKPVEGSQANTFSLSVGLLSRQDYVKSGSVNSFINNGTEFWLADETANNEHFFICSDGSIAYTDSVSVNKGVRPVFAFSFDTYAVSGDGTKENPYVIRVTTAEETPAQKASEMEVGDCVSYGDIKWLVVSLDENGNAVLVSTVKTDVAKTYEKMLQYLNTEFKKTLPDADKVLLEHEWNTGFYNDFLTQDFTYIYNYETTSSGLVGIANSSVLFINGFTDVFYNTGFATSSDLVAYVSEDGYILSSFKSGPDAEQHYAVPVICVNADTIISSGEGNLNMPYILEGGQDEQ